MSWSAKFHDDLVEYMSEGLVPEGSACRQD